MNRNCNRLICSLGRPMRLCREDCRRAIVRGVKDETCPDCDKLKEELMKSAEQIGLLKAEISSLKMGNIEPIKEEDAAEETPKRKYNKRK